MQKRKVFTQSGKLVHRTGPGRYASVGRTELDGLSADFTKIDSHATFKAAYEAFLAAINATAQEINNAADISARTAELTATGEVAATVRFVELNHATVAIVATMAQSPVNEIMIIKNTSASGTAAHQFVLTSGTLDGTNNTATLDAPGECLIVAFDSAGNGVIIENIGVVALS